MDRLKSTRPGGKRVLNNLCLFSVLSALAISFFGHFGIVIVPFASAFYAALILFDDTKKRLATLFVGALFILLDILFYGFYSYNGLCAVIVGIVFYLVLKKERDKFYGAIVITLIIFLFALLSVYLFGALNCGSLSFGAVREFYSGLISEYSRMMYDAYGEFVSYDDGTATLVYTKEVIDSAIYGLVSMFVPLTLGLSFILTGLGFKTLWTLIGNYASGGESIYTFRFTPNGFHCAVYIIVFLLQMVAGASDNLFGLTVCSLYVLMSFAFFYVGFNVLVSLLSLKVNVRFARIGVVLGLLAFLDFGFVIVCFIGVWFSFTAGRLMKKQ